MIKTACITANLIPVNLKSMFTYVLAYITSKEEIKKELIL